MDGQLALPLVLLDQRDAQRGLVLKKLEQVNATVLFPTVSMWFRLLVAVMSVIVVVVVVILVIVVRVVN